ncbi:MAG: CvpA family protein [Planctomycetaceae bacterium]|nr:CvpA family protein [Planctomycetaceae bacterium]
MWYDVLALAILAFTTIRGAMKGVIWQIAAIAGLVLCFVFSESISAAAGPYIKLEPPLNNWVVMIGAYLVFSLASFSVARLLTEWLDKIQFGDFNRHLGAIFGFIKGALIVLVLTFFSVTVSERMHDVLQHSRTGHLAALVMFHLHPIMPKQLHETLARYINIHKLDDAELTRRYAEQDRHADDDEAAAADAADLILPAEFEELLSKVPPETKTEFQALLMRTLQKNEPETRLDLWDSLINAFKKANSADDLSSLMQTLKQPSDRLMGDVKEWSQTTASPSARTTAGDFPQVVPEEDGPPVITAATPPSPRDRLLQEISAEFSRFPLAQQRIRTDIESQLSGVPDAVVVSVLEDWRSDLAALHPGAGGTIIDPDPSTNSATMLRQRIERQTARGAAIGIDEERLQ